MQILCDVQCLIIHIQSLFFEKPLVLLLGEHLLHQTILTAINTTNFGILKHHQLFTFS